MQMTASKVMLLAAIAAFLLAACEGSSDPKGNVSSGPADQNAVEIDIQDAQFSPSTLELPAGDTITVEVSNHDGTTHDFAIESMNLNTGTIESDGVATATFTVPDEPTEFVCTYHDGMAGTIEPQ
jgi:plastocyanin